MKVNLTKTREVFNYCKPYIIAELGSNHNGDMELAKKLITEAKDAGVDCVKFQSWSKETIFAKEKYEDNYFIADDYRDRSDFTLEKIVEKYAISEQELIDMKAFADELGVDCTSTPFSEKEVDFLVDKLNTPFIKVASMDLNNYPFLEYIAKKGKPIVISTGLSNLNEIDRAIKTIEDAGNKQIIILHCVATYPTPDKDVNLNNVKTLMSIYPNYPVGFSDHTLGSSIPLASVALGACLLEKHFTLDQDMEGWDHKISATKEEMKDIVINSKRISDALGSKRITVTESKEKVTEFRRSIVIINELKAGETILKENITYKRPGTGITPGDLKHVLGRKLNKDLKADALLKWEYLN